MLHLENPNCDDETAKYQTSGNTSFAMHGNCRGFVVKSAGAGCHRKPRRQSIVKATIEVFFASGACLLPATVLAPLPIGKHGGTHGQARGLHGASTGQAR
jgi:hypothetical protein